MLIDQFGRQINYLRVSLTDRCNFRCSYCMSESMQFAPRSENLHVEELELICRAFVELGVEKIRLTGGEPLIHPDFEDLLQRLSGLAGLKNIALTTNAALLVQRMNAIAASKVSQVNISLDSIDKANFSRITRSHSREFDNVMAGIDAAVAAGIPRIRLNTVVSSGVNDHELAALLAFAIAKGVHIAFIEEMPMGDMASYNRSTHYLSNIEVKRRLKSTFDLIPQTQKRLQAGPAQYYQVAGSDTDVGFISPHSNNFCSSCNRVRLTRKGQLVLCLGNEENLDLRAVIRAADTAADAVESIKRSIVEALQRKPESHYFDIHNEEPQVLRFMSDTGG